MISVITPNYNGSRYLAQAIESVLAQRRAGVDLEYIVVDGGSTDGSLAILERYRSELARLVVESDRGPASAINKGFALARGEMVGWLNADDLYHPGALARVAEGFALHPGRALGFGRCRIVDVDGREIRKGITRFKEAAFDYDLVLRLWRQGGAFRIPGPPLADFRWHAGSISGRGFREQFREEYEAARRDAGPWAPQVWLHAGVRWGIVTIYSRMAARRRAPSEKRGE